MASGAALAATDAFGSSLTPPTVWRLAGFWRQRDRDLGRRATGPVFTVQYRARVVARKLLLTLPRRANPHQRRGILLEPLIRETFLRQSGAVRQPEWTQRIATHRPARWPWMQATPDDIVELAGRRVLVDYKAPRRTADRGVVPYACQLHQTGFDRGGFGGMPSTRGSSWPEPPARDSRRSG